MNYYILLLIIISVEKGSGKIQNDKYELIEVIKDFLLQLKMPLRITTSTLCWSKDNFISLSKTLMNNGFLTTPSKGNLSTYWPHEQQLFLVDMACDGFNETLILADKLNLLEYPFKWILIEDPNNPQLKPNLTIYVRSKIYIIQKQNEGYAIVSKYRLGKFSYDYHTNDVAYWNNKQFLYFNKLLDSRNRTNLMKQDVNMSIVVLDPDTTKHLLDTKDRHIEPATKVNYPLSLHMIEAINATPQLIQRNTWGYKGNNAHFKGMMGDMEFKLADICATATFYIEERIPFIDIVASTTHTKAKFIFRGPPLSYVENIYVLPFNVGVWIACFILIFTTPIIFYIITKWESLNKHQEPNNSIPQLQPEFKDILHLQIGAVCQQGSEAEPISGAGRIATIFIFICMLFLYTAYSANIVALIQSTSNNIKTLEDLLSSRIKLGVEDIPYNKYYFTIEPGVVQKEIYHQKVAPPGKPNNFMDLHTGVTKMKQEFFAFHTETTTIYKIVSDTFLEHEKCALQEIEYFNMYEPYFAIRKNTTYGEILKAAIKKMEERGIARRAYNRIYLKKPLCANQSGSFLSVSLIDCYAAFLIFGIGIGISTFVFVVEKIVNYKVLKSTANNVVELDVSDKSIDIDFLN